MLLSSNIQRVKSHITKKQLRVFSILFVFLLCLYYWQQQTSNLDIRLRNEGNSFYKSVLDKNPRFEQFRKDQRCLVYFNQLTKSNPEWKMNQFEDAASVNQMNDELRHLRVYGKCVLEKDEDNEMLLINANTAPTEGEISKDKMFYLFDNLKHLKNSLFKAPLETLPSVIKDCSVLQGKIFPYLTNRIPAYTRWTGETYYDIPQIEKVREANKNQDSKVDLDKIRFDTDFSAKASKSIFHPCLVNYYRKSLRGKGIVLTTNGKFAPQVVALVKMLRALGNEFPIQIFHTGLSKKRVAQIIYASREDLDVPQDIFQLLLEEQQQKYGKYPPQEVWFVDIRNCFQKEYSEVLSGYGNKLSALLFSTFEDMILMDADTIPFVPLKTFFEMSQYTESKTLFFQDRTDLRYNKDEYVEFFTKLFPNELDTRLFGIPAVTSHTLGNRFIGRKYYYFMEAGLVAINKKQHYVGLLTAFQLNLWHKVTNDMIWGDKECYWLGLSIAGDENYQFNSKGAVSIGELSTKEQHFYGRESKSNELCSTHPGQVSDNDNHTLLWVNSGLETCKNLKSISWDNSQPRYKSKKRPELRAYYHSPLRINAALEPPMITKEYRNKIHEPDRGWKQTQFCYSYLWCAYDRVNASTDLGLQGHLIRYNETETRWFDYLGQVWASE